MYGQQNVKFKEGIFD